ncbi:HlyD family secretion protein [Aureimonas altamirensis DSM 21988]|uniref:Secretion protein HylD n=2 Tax=Aureimonas altamirensis TaxID=370622 RepID=A0A0B1PZQ7_9HYPH|nr:MULTISPECIES: efflux RND transporter periplasmic adaptor subunit [Aureimonas]KHJ54028.1 secretion protein HylD [Aureimonas altamirensis]QOG06826.1 efflux RND transporter periplasmic adaptor subunit [Aureimonas sp. OT7]SHJ79187.1 HlyD family secretion protein [Aureimonas altamirensis DSM 21988]
MKSRIALIIAVVALAGIAALSIWASLAPAAVLVQGEVEATRVDIAPKVSGEIAAVHVNEGERVEAGTLLVELESPQLMAGLASAEAAAGVARADRARINSTRPEVIAARRAELEKAEADLVLARQSYDRVSVLTERSAASQQQLDSAENSLSAAQAAVAAAEANLTLAIDGASSEERAVADAQVQQAEASLNQTRTDVGELSISAPISGEVVSRVAEVGALAAAGAPLLSIVDLDNVWFTFNLREDLLDGLTVGDRLHARVPAIGGRDVELRVTSISALGAYANWRATRATGDFDLRTFRIRARPVEPALGLRPGMSAIIDWRTGHAGR